jgi:hypothetical protein
MSILSAGTSNTTSLIYTGDTTGNLAFQVNGTTEAMRITSGGNVGIGTNNPVSKLDVFADTATFGDTGSFNFAINGTNILFKNGAGGTTERMRITSTGQALINSTTLFDPNNYSSSGSKFLQVRSTDTDRGSFVNIVGGGGGSPGYWLGGINFAVSGQTYAGASVYSYTSSSSTSADLMFATSGNTSSGNPTERMRILSDGSILLGTSTQGGATGISFSNASDSALYGKSMYMNSPYNGTRNAISFAYNSAGGVGQIVTGTNSVSYQSGSDYRLKKDIAPMTGALATVAQLKPVTFKWKSDSSNGQGFIAHEIQAIVPDCATGEKDAVDAEGKPVYQGVDTSFLVATLTAAIQELNAKVEAQAAEIAALKGNN